MSFVESVLNDHKNIERELVELDTIIEDSEETINYPNLLYVLKTVYNIWDEHEQKEDSVFKIFKKMKIKIPVEKMIFEHKSLRQYREDLEKTFASNDASKIKNAVRSDLKKIIIKLREHIENEENTLWMLPMEDIFSVEELNKMDRLFNNLEK